MVRIILCGINLENEKYDSDDSDFIRMVCNSFFINFVALATLLLHHPKANSEIKIWNSEIKNWNSEIEFQNSNVFFQNSQIEI